MQNECTVNVPEEKIHEEIVSHPPKRVRIDFADLLEKKAKENSLSIICND